MTFTEKEQGLFNCGNIRTMLPYPNAKAVGSDLETCCTCWKQNDDDKKHVLLLEIFILRDNDYR